MIVGTLSGTREMAQYSRSPVTVAEDLGSIPNTHMLAQNHL